MTIVDTHAHLDFCDDLDGWIGRAKADGVDKIIAIGTSVEASRKCVELAEKYSTRHSRESENLESRFPIRSGMTGEEGVQIYATVGIHAEDGKGDVEKYGGLEKCIEMLKSLILRDKQVQHDSSRPGICCQDPRSSYFQ